MIAITTQHAAMDVALRAYCQGVDDAVVAIDVILDNAMTVDDIRTQLATARSRLKHARAASLGDQT
jgi:hypothetical protein